MKTGREGMESAIEAILRKNCMGSLTLSWQES